jgi:hypothetical protein
MMVNIEDFITDLENNDFQINYIILGIKFDTKIGFHIMKKNNYSCCIDMFTFTPKNDMLMQTKIANYVWPKENYYYNEVFPLKKAKFNNIYLPIPNNSEAFCKRAYKDNYMDIIYIHHPHPFNFLGNIIDGIGIQSVSKEKFYIKDLIE